MPADSRAFDVAAVLERAVRAQDHRMHVEHFGSTSVPGCGGKGVVDLALLYPAGALEDAKALVDGLGFQRQDGRDPWPESRPMRIASVEVDDCVFRVHMHVIAAGSSELVHVRRFRRLLIEDEELRRSYEREKQRIIADGVRDPVEYSERKGQFIRAALEQA